MRLEDKGPIVPPPVLRGHAQRVVEHVRRWRDIVCVTHWHFADRQQVDGVDFYVGDRELGHLHLDGELHLLTTPSLRSDLVAAGLANPFRWDPDRWVTAPVRLARDVERALWLLRTSYDRLMGTPVSTLRRRVAERR